MDAVVRFEVPADDLGRAEKFYASAFGWTAYAVPMGDADYVTLTTVPVDRTNMMPTRPGAINGGLVERSEAMSAPVVTIGVASIDTALERVTASGGSVVLPRTEVPGAPSPTSRTAKAT